MLCARSNHRIGSKIRSTRRFHDRSQLSTSSGALSRDSVAFFTRDTWRRRRVVIHGWTLAATLSISILEGKTNLGAQRGAWNLSLPLPPPPHTPPIVAVTHLLRSLWRGGIKELVAWWTCGRGEKQCGETWDFLVTGDHRPSLTNLRMDTKGILSRK